MKISIIGMGYVGLVTGICFCDYGHKVICIEKDEKKIKDLNDNKEIIYEPGLKKLLKKHVNKNFFPSNDINNAVQKTNITFIAVGTPFEKGQFSTKFLKNAARDIGLALRNKKKFHVIVVKSTVIPGTTDNLIKKQIEKFSKKKAGKDFGLSMNPEFLREGEAINDFINSDRIVVGADTTKTKNIVKKIYSRFKNVPILFTNNKTAELIKYTSNSLLANLISFSNEISNIGDKIGDINFNEVIKAVSLDRRIAIKVGKKKYFPGIVSYMEPGCGFGGSCFPKDVKALSSLAKTIKSDDNILKNIIKTNEKQIIKLSQIVLKNVKKGKNKVLILGLSFKPGTDDIRESPSIKLIEQLLKYKNIDIEVFDPIALENTMKKFKNRIKYGNKLSNSIVGKDIIIVMTKWSIFSNLDLKLKKNHNPLVIDPRRFLNFKKFKKYIAFGIS